QGGGISRLSIPSVRPLQATGVLGLRMPVMMLGDDRGELGRTRAAQSLCAHLSVIGVDPVAAGEGGPGALRRLQSLWGEGPPKNALPPCPDRAVARPAAVAGLADARDGSPSRARRGHAAGRSRAARGRTEQAAPGFAQHSRFPAT